MSYKIASGWNVVLVDMDRVKGVLQYDPLADRVPLGSVKRTTLNGATQFNGKRTITWKWNAMTRTNLNTLLGYLGGDTSVGSAKVTIYTPNYKDTFTRYNAYMINPEPQTDWTRIPAGAGAVENLVVTFLIVEEAT